jgi:branched-chain amino acid transport system ATP-binding protein
LIAIHGKFVVFQLIGRGQMAGPRILMLDELSLGLALRIAHWGFVLESGRVVLSGTGAELVENQRVREAYLGL